MKKIIYSFAYLLCLATMTSCNDWLDIKPNNEQITDDYWKSKEDVESVVTSGYYYMRQCVPTFLKWGELRGGTFYSTSTTDSKLQDFNMTPSHSLCKYDAVYSVISAANSVIKYAPAVKAIDNTYNDAVMNSHICEAYFQRAYCYLILLKNYGSVPLVLEPYVDDYASFDIAKSTPEEVAAQIKKDVETALETGAAKGYYETDWQTKGRATKWALYALMADVCLWTEDYDECIKYCDMILNATNETDAFRPVFMSNTSDWYTMFYPGNSNESIFELNWDYNTALETNNFASYWTQAASSPFLFTTSAKDKMQEETDEVIENSGQSVSEGRTGRMIMATYMPQSGTTSGYATASTYYLWKYAGTDILDFVGGARSHQDANFIIYRVAEIMLMKAQALTMKGEYTEAIALVDQIRVRAGLQKFIPDSDNPGELTLLQEILDQKEMEFIAEGKRWYDLLWFGKVGNYKYEEHFVTMVIEGNQTTNKSWIISVLKDHNAWYLPIPQADIDHNRLLEQNPYYTTN